MTFLLFLILAVIVMLSIIFTSENSSLFRGFFLPMIGAISGITLFISLIGTTVEYLKTPARIAKYQEETKYITTHLNSKDGHERVKSADLALGWNTQIEQTNTMKDNIWIGCMYPDTIAGLTKFDLSKFVTDSLVTK